MCHNGFIFYCLTRLWLPLCLVMSFVPKLASSREVFNRIVAVVENEVLTLHELETKAKPFLAKLDDIRNPAERDQQRKQILKQVLDIEIDERLVNAEIERSRERLGVTDKDVDRAVEEVVRMNNLTQDQLQAALYAQGLSWSEYRLKLRSQIERARLIQFQVQGKVQISDQDARQRCQTRHQSGRQNLVVCAAHILKRIPPTASAKEIEQIRTRMSQLQAEVASGADFAAFALKYSDDTSAPNGDLGCFGRGEMVEPFEQTAFALDVGQVSPVIRTTFGFHIIKVLDKKRPVLGECDNEETLTEFRNELYQEEMDRQTKQWVEELRRKSFVDIRL